MLRIGLLAAGFAMVLVQHYAPEVAGQIQWAVFFAGVLLLGVPHGAADLLVATQNTGVAGDAFSKPRFFAAYLGRILLFATLLWFFPVAGTAVFLLLAAYHFGETDLHQFRTDTFAGKLLVTAYGLVILGFILFRHFDEVRPILRLFGSGVDNAALADWLQGHGTGLMAGFGLFFLVSAAVYFRRNGSPGGLVLVQFAIQFSLLLTILHLLPMLLGFTFYFVAWHSVLSLHSIVAYLKSGHTHNRAIAGQILLYSALAIGGMAVAGLAGFAWVSENAIAGCLFMGLAVLTAPHVPVMHGMYNRIRARAAAS